MIRAVVMTVLAFGLATSASAQTAHTHGSTPPPMQAMSVEDMGRMTHAEAAPVSVLTASEPAENSAVDGPPPALSLIFARPMRLDGLNLIDESGETIPIDASEFSPAPAIRIPLPALRPGRWEADWRASGPDDVIATGEIDFTVQ